MRNALLDCAVDHFSRFGFEGAATRAIAADCGTAMSSITYHFGGKEGLFLAAADYIAGQMAAAHAPALAAAHAAIITSREDAVEQTVKLLDQFAERMLGEESALWAKFMTREQQEPNEAFDRIYAIAMRPLLDAFYPLLAAARPDLDQTEQAATSFLLFGQVLALRAARASLVRIIDGPLDSAAESLLRRRLAAHVRAILSAEPETNP
jgi:TetR/AcrR family transcriptional regulator, regulator of cefoperazone and chloramphenicol sensitivity